MGHRGRRNGSHCCNQIRSYLIILIRDIMLLNWGGVGHDGCCGGESRSGSCEGGGGGGGGVEDISVANIDILIPI